jgi:hypothetical protein
MKSEIKNAILIQANTEQEGVSLEYGYIAEQFRGWKPVMQALLKQGNRWYDKKRIKNVITKETQELYFDITNFFGKLR